MTTIFESMELVLSSKIQTLQIHTFVRYFTNQNMCKLLEPFWDRPKEEEGKTMPKGIENRNLL